MATAQQPGLIDGVPAYTVKVNAKFPGANPALRGVHLTALGADEPGKIELGPDILTAGRLIVDDVRLALQMGAPANAGLGADAIATTLGPVLAGRDIGRYHSGQLTLYTPVGLPWQDLALEARLGMTSKNSSKPPSSDGLGKSALKSLRKKSGQRPGRPKGQDGLTLSRVDGPDHEVPHEPGVSCGCGGGLGDAPVVGVERRQVFDLPALRLLVTEHQLISRVCSCGTVTKGQAPAGVVAPVQYGSRLAGTGVYLSHGQFLSTSRTVQSLADLFGAKIAAGTLVSWTKRVAGQVTCRVIPVIVHSTALLGATYSTPPSAFVAHSRSTSSRDRKTPDS